jgi:hypothetical protein
VEHGDAPASNGGHDVHRPTRDPAQPARAVAAFAVKERRSHDAVARAARGDGSLAGELGGEEAAVGILVQTQRRDVDEAPAAEGARRGEGARGSVMHELIGFGAALAQDAYGVYHRIAAGNEGVPGAPRAKALEVLLAQLAAA